MPQHSNAKVDADYIYCILNKGRMTLSELSSFTHLDVHTLNSAIAILRAERELFEYQENCEDYLELKIGYQI